MLSILRTEGKEKLKFTAIIFFIIFFIRVDISRYRDDSARAPSLILGRTSVLLKAK